MFFSKKFTIIEHTADIGIKVRGRSLENLFENSAIGMCSIISDISKIEPNCEYKNQISGIDKENVLVNYLNDLLFQIFNNNLLFSAFKINLIMKGNDEISIRTSSFGEKYSLEKHGPLTEIKAVTYYGLRIRKSFFGYVCRIFFDM